MKKTELAVALDFAEVRYAEGLMGDLAGLPVVYKVGLELFMSVGPDWVGLQCERGYRIFLDLKLHDIPNTVANALKQAVDLGVEYTTVHLAGGPRMIEGAEIPSDSKLKIIGVSVLTSFSDKDWVEAQSNFAHHPFSIEKAVLSFADLASHHPKISGMVCSAREVALVRAKYPEIALVVPGIRPLGVTNDDQSRVMTPKEAALAGASMIVMGRPITKAPNARQVAEQTLKEISIS